tara:strand:- start:7600 stop:8298 length:699 start_codon:yes stop_codon:yes gene_type:complete
MKAIVFDSGPIINLAMNNILWLIDPLKKQFKGQFIIGRRVKKELIDYPLEKTKKFQFEALQTLKLVEKKLLTVFPEKDFDLENKLFELFNSVFIIKGRPLKVVHGGEVEAVAIAIKTGSNVVAIDERTTRLILEEPKVMARIFEKKLHSKIKINQKALNELQSLTKNVRMIRSMELVIYAYEKGLLDRYKPISLKNPKKILLHALIWGIKLHGCSITVKDMDEIMKIEAKRR